MSPSDMGPVLPAMSFVPARMTTTWGCRSITSCRKRASIGGQTTPQMLARFRQDVIDLHPQVVVILAGTNDIVGYTVPMSLGYIEATYSFLEELARAHN